MEHLAETISVLGGEGLTVHPDVERVFTSFLNNQIDSAHLYVNKTDETLIVYAGIAQRGTVSEGMWSLAVYSKHRSGAHETIAYFDRHGNLLVKKPYVIDHPISKEVNIYTNFYKQVFEIQLKAEEEFTFVDNYGIGKYGYDVYNRND